MIGLVLCFIFSANAQTAVQYDPTVQPKTDMQYFKPVGNLFVGDCMPFFHDGTFSLYWLLDSAHHKSLNGLGGHQWALSTTKDLKTWKQFPLVLKIDEAWEKSICTGSVVFYKGKYYSFYATRLINGNPTDQQIKEASNGIWSFVNEQLSYAVSDDGVHFEKQQPNPFYTSAPGYSKRNFRDPKVFVDQDGEFHLFVASEQVDPVMSHAAGCLVHLTSKDLKQWNVLDPILTGQASVPECPDYYFWKGWYYLVYSDNSNTFYVKSKKPYGPWETPRYQALNEDLSNVVKTAEFLNNRRIAASWIPNRMDNNDNSHEIFGGNTLFREITQEPDGTLDTEFPAELIPGTGNMLSNKIHLDLDASLIDAGGVSINSPGGVGAAHIEGVPSNCRITVEITPKGTNEEFGLYLSAAAHAQSGYRLNFSAGEKMVSLGNTSIKAVEGLNQPFKIDIIIKDGIIDVDVNHKRTIVNRTYEQHGDFVWFYAKHGKVDFTHIQISPLL